MSRINHARHAHRGRQTEAAFPVRPKAWNDNQKAKPANAGRRLSDDEIAELAAARGMRVAGL